jgi:hypothetical protein
MLEVIIAVAILAVIAAPLIILARSPQLAWDDPAGVPLPGASREEIAGELNVDPDDLDADAEEELDGIRH